MPKYEWKEVDGGLEYSRPFMRARVYKDLFRGWMFQVIVDIGNVGSIVESTGFLSGSGDLRDLRRNDAERVMDALSLSPQVND